MDQKKDNTLEVMEILQTIYFLLALNFRMGKDDQERYVQKQTESPMQCFLVERLSHKLTNK